MPERLPAAPMSALLPAIDVSGGPVTSSEAREALIAAVADVLREHWMTWDARGIGWRCGCGHLYATQTAPPLHQAAHVAAALRALPAEERARALGFEQVGRLNSGYFHEELKTCTASCLPLFAPLPDRGTQ